MDTIIQEANFLHDDKKIAKEFEILVQTWKEKNKKTIATGQINSGFHTLGKKLMEPKCPTFKTHGWSQAAKVCHVLEDLAGDQIVVGATHSDEFHEVLYKLLIEWFQYGPATVHLEIAMSIIKHRHLGMKEFVTSQKDEKLNKLLRAASSPVVKKEDTADKAFYGAYRDYVEYFFKLAFEESQLMMEDSMKIRIDFMFHLHLDYFHLEDDSVQQLVRVAKSIQRTYSDKWTNFSDVPRLKSYINKFCDLAKIPGFPRNKAVADWTYESLSTVTKLLQKFNVEEFSNEIFDLIEVVSQAQGDTEDVVRVFSAAVVFFDRRGSNKNNPTVFKAVAPRYIALISLLDVTFLRDTKFVPEIMTMLENSYADNKELTAQWISLSVPLLRRNTLKTINACRNVLLKHDKIKWKEHQEPVVQLLEAIKDTQLPSGNARKPYMKELTTCINYLLRGLKKARILKQYGETLLFLSIQLLELRESELYNAAEDAGEHIEIDVKEKKDSVMEVMKRLHVYIKDEAVPLDACWPLKRAVVDIIESVFKCVTDSKIFSEEDLAVFTSMSVTCLGKEVIDPDSGTLSHHFSTGISIMSSLLEWLGERHQLVLAKDLIPLLIDKMNEEDATAYSCVSRFLVDFSNLDSAVLAPYFDTIFNIYLEKETYHLLMPVMSMYSNTDVSIKNHFKQVFTQMIETNDKQLKDQLPSLLWQASKKEPDLFTEDIMGKLIEHAKKDTSNQALHLQSIQEVCRQKPGRLVKHVGILTKRDGWNPMILAIVNGILSTLALYDKSLSQQILEYSIQCAKRSSDKGALLTAMNAIRLIGFKYPDVIKPKRQDIENLEIIDADGQGQKQNILDIIDGKTSENVKKQLEAQQEAVSGLVDKVEDVEVTVAAMAVDLEDQKESLDNVINDVTEHGQRLDQVEGAVEETVKKVEEVDKKTLSHAPYWSRDISKLLNPATEHDWRLLSGRLGYSNADIRGWAQQADPCMAMLNEWYANRKTGEATLAVLTNLQEMNRMDAALIVENAMKKAEAVVEDEEFEYASPPEIFLSYQWGHQEEVKILCRHLAMAGYDCWMDVGQMGGGDKLFEKIDSGMRSSKLVISCVTDKYAKSPNCNREVSLAVGVRKPVIPLLLESCPWPPHGSMGPIFSESLYIPFFWTGEKETKDDRFWPVEKFRELLMQLSANGLNPDEGRIDEIYRKWWLPLEETVVVETPKTQSGGNEGSKPENTQTEGDSQSEKSPDIFISYQWDKQKTIIKLYQRLTSLGFSCWLDIKQMGGGDSLYQKIDKGIRGSKVVVSCVTKKYAMSANCCREVSLTDALKKPLLPLLLEEMMWPPSGPMSMALTQLLYIGFQQETLQSNWEGPEFDQLVAKLRSHLGTDTATTDKSDTKDATKGEKEEPKSELNKDNSQPAHTVEEICAQAPKDDDAKDIRMNDSKNPKSEDKVKPDAEADQTTGKNSPSQASEDVNKGNQDTLSQTRNGDTKSTDGIQPHEPITINNATTNTQTPTENGNTNSQTPTENGNTNSQTPTENGNTNSQTPTENDNANSQTPTENDNANSQTPTENGNTNPQTPTENGKGTSQVLVDNDKKNVNAQSLIPKDERGEMRARSATTKKSPPEEEDNSSKERVLPPPSLRLQTSRSCCIL